jgi:hypothetical protein
MSDSIWYGELRASKGNTIVIRDSELPAASKGRIYLYNTVREAIIEYDESIVSPKLFPLDNEQIKQAESEFKAGWESARKQLLSKNGKSSPSSEPETPTKNNKSIEKDLLPSDEDVSDDDDDE